MMPTEPSPTVLEKLTELGASSIVTALARFARPPPRPQPAEGVTYARKIEKSEAQIDWTQSALDLERRIRAFDPFPGAEARLTGQVLKIWRAELVDSIAMPEANPPGTVVKTGADIVNVQCGRGILALKTIQKPGGNRLAVADFLRSTTIQTGTSLT